MIRDLSNPGKLQFLALTNDAVMWADNLFPKSFGDGHRDAFDMLSGRDVGRFVRARVGREITAAHEGVPGHPARKKRWICSMTLLA